MTALESPARGVGSVEEKDSIARLYSQLECPPPARQDPALAAEVNRRLADWAGRYGLYPGRPELLQALDLGGLIVRVYPSADDVDRLLMAAQLSATAWSFDDLGCDDDAAEGLAHGTIFGLMPMLTVLDPAALTPPYHDEFERQVSGNNLLNAYRASLQHLRECSDDRRVLRYVTETTQLFVAWAAEANWRVSAHIPSITEYLITRQCNGFQVLTVLIDAVTGYNVPDDEWARPDVRKAAKLANMAGLIVNDLYSLRRENRPLPLDTNLVRLIAHHDEVSVTEAIRRTIAMHNEYVREFESLIAELTRTGSAQLNRYLRGLEAWMTGNFDWHRTSSRYALPTDLHPQQP